MITYTKEHLESVPPEFVTGLKLMVEEINAGNYTALSCPAVIAEEHGFVLTCYDDLIKGLCPEHLLFIPKRSPCPCEDMGLLGGLEMIRDFIEQWDANNENNKM